MSPRERGQGKTPHRALRVEDDLWGAFGDAVARQGEPDRSTVTREFIRWYVGEPGAKMPRRPPKDTTDRGHSGPVS
jgi:hypothetical protein